MRYGTGILNRRLSRPRAGSGLFEQDRRSDMRLSGRSRTMLRALVSHQTGCPSRIGSPIQVRNDGGAWLEEELATKGECLRRRRVFSIESKARR